MFLNALLLYHRHPLLMLTLNLAQRARTNESVWKFPRINYSNLHHEAPYFLSCTSLVRYCS